MVRVLRGRRQDSDVWPVVLVVLAVLVPAACLLWFMGAAIRNERFAVRQKLADVYRAQLSVPRTRLQQYWRDTAAALEKLAATSSAPVAFEQCARSGNVDGIIIFNEKGGLSYPNTPAAVKSDSGELQPKWQEASQVEHRRRFVEAARQYDAVAQETKNIDVAARAFQAEARCLVQSGQNDTATRLISEVFSMERYRHAADPQGRLIAANAELMVLELITNRNSPIFQFTARRLATRLMDYENSVLAAPQRRFLMSEVQRLSLEQIEFPTLSAEDLAAEVVEKHSTSLSPQRGEGRGEGWDPVNASSTASPQFPGPSIVIPAEARGLTVQRGAIADLWQFTTPNRRVLALIRSEKLFAAAKAAITDNSPADAVVTLVPPDAETSDAFVTLPVGETMPGWRLALSFKDRMFFDATTGRRTAVYLWAGILVMAVTGVLTLLTLRLVRRQMAVARLKNDLAATVSHELKTPLASMRVLIDTLLDSDKFDEQRTREYLELIARENERLGRLIQDFLTFSRMERRQYLFHFSPVQARQVIENAIEAMRGRFAGFGGSLDVQIEADLPPIMADPDNLATALVNLLENACKYSNEDKQIIVGARAENGSVIFSVKDNGIGIAPRERKRIFQPFYQVDQQLSRKGSGCGLGLSIVHFIAKAHQGTVSFESQSGRGSTFAISVPVAPDAKRVGREAIA